MIHLTAKSLRPLILAFFSVIIWHVASATFTSAGKILVLPNQVEFYNLNEISSSIPFATHKTDV